MVALTDREQGQFWHSPRAWFRLRLHNAIVAATIGLAAAGLAGQIPWSGWQAIAALLSLAIPVTLIFARARRIHKSASFQPFAVLNQLGRPGI